MYHVELLRRGLWMRTYTVETWRLATLLGDLHGHYRIVASSGGVAISAALALDKGLSR